jgi:hypothetical protein
MGCSECGAKKRTVDLLEERSASRPGGFAQFPTNVARQLKVLDKSGASELQAPQKILAARPSSYAAECALRGQNAKPARVRIKPVTGSLANTPALK